MLVLDNCEHLLDTVAPLVAVLLGRCPALTVLATSRAPLAVAGERLFPLAPMSDGEAAELFGTRALMSRPELQRGGAGAGRRPFAVPGTRRPAARGRTRRRARAVAARAEIERRLDNRFTLLAKGKRTRARPAPHPARRPRLELRPPGHHRTTGAHRTRPVRRRLLPRHGARRRSPSPARTATRPCGYWPNWSTSPSCSPFRRPTGAGCGCWRRSASARWTGSGPKAGRAEAEERFMAWALHFVHDSAPGGQGSGSAGTPRSPPTSGRPPTS
ncbi:hypothetical protein ACRAWF_15210 [Streptomyces sp. L7]